MDAGSLSAPLAVHHQTNLHYNGDSPASPPRNQPPPHNLSDISRIIPEDRLNLTSNHTPKAEVQENQDASDEDEQDELDRVQNTSTELPIPIRSSKWNGMPLQHFTSASSPNSKAREIDSRDQGRSCQGENQVERRSSSPRFSLSTTRIRNNHYLAVMPSGSHPSYASDAFSAGNNNQPHPITITITSPSNSNSVQAVEIHSPTNPHTRAPDSNHNPGSEPGTASVDTDSAKTQGIIVQHGFPQDLTSPDGPAHPATTPMSQISAGRIAGGAAGSQTPTILDFMLPQRKSIRPFARAVKEEWVCPRFPVRDLSPSPHHQHRQHRQPRPSHRAHNHDPQAWTPGAGNAVNDEASDYNAESIESMNMEQRMRRWRFDFDEEMAVTRCSSHSLDTADDSGYAADTDMAAGAESEDNVTASGIASESPASGHHRNYDGVSMYSIPSSGSGTVGPFWSGYGNESTTTLLRDLQLESGDSIADAGNMGMKKRGGKKKMWRRVISGTKPTKTGKEPANK